MYNVNKIFRSIQGEGAFIGWPATFVRFQGCNLRCKFCDTPDALDRDIGVPVTLGQIADTIVRTAKPHDLIIFTGGEPTLQPLERLIEELHQRVDNAIHIETNGTRPIPHGLDWVVVSPKRQKMPAPATFLRVNEIKWLVGPADDIPPLLEVVEQYHLEPQMVCLQPIDCDGGATEIAYKAALEHGFRLSIQIHKFIGVE